MANTPDYNWPPMEKRRIIGKPYKRVDGPQKASGRAKYSSDLRPKDLLFGVYLTCPHAHARVTSIDTSGAEKTAGVKAVHVVSPAGTEFIRPRGCELAHVPGIDLSHRTIALLAPIHPVDRPFRAFSRGLQRLVVNLFDLLPNRECCPGKKNDPGKSHEKPSHSL